MKNDTKRILNILGIIVAILSANLPKVSASSHRNEGKPNIILIFADDLGYGDVGIFNKNCPFETPRLDRMAREGAMLTDFYVPTPYCAPSRGTILTGRYPFRHSVVRNPAPDAGQNNIGLPSSEITIAEVLKEQGYGTAMFGKWHLGHREQWLPRTQGFDEYQGILYSNDMFPVQMVKNEEVIEYPVFQGKLSQLYTDLTLDYIRRKKDEPFFVYLPMAMPHKPLAVSDNFYTPDTPDNLYADVIKELDFSVGRILDGLKELNLEKNTLVLFTSDNGPFYGGSSAGLRGMKGRTWEGGLRVPVIAYMPGTIPQGVVNHHPAATIDILPTICDLTQIPVPTDRTIDGMSILNMLKDSSHPSPHEAIFGMSGANLAMIRSGNWKLHVRNPGSVNMVDLPPEEARKRLNRRAPDGVTIIAPFEQPDPTEYPGISTGVEPKAMMLFNMETDPGEQIDVAEIYPDVVKRLKKLFDQTEDQIPDFPAPEVEFLLTDEAQKSGELMRLIGGELRYDRIPNSQKHLLKK
ncbi:MAG: sulfatase [Verrucomicrobia bacterium]|nr:sulfatase [Verrucomicrobiota bacterium]MDA1065291.1 sulfatase [Verrucomicrobiota bacterium]